MRARACLPFALLLLLAPAAGAETGRFVPSLVLDGTVPAYVAGLDAGSKVTLAIGDVAVTKEAAVDGGVLVHLAGLEPGLQEWALSVFDGNVTTTTHGFVLVDAELAGLRASVALKQESDAQTIANLTASLRAFEAALQARQNSTLGNITARLDALPLAALGNGSVLAAAPPAAVPVSVAPGGADWTAAVPVGALALLLLPVHAVALLQVRKARREALMLLLVLAAKAGITPDSPEFKGALEAFERKRPKAAQDEAPAAA